MFEPNVILIFITGIVGGLTYFVQDGINHKWDIKYPKLFQRAKKVLIPAYVLGFVASLWVTICSNSENNYQKQTLQNNFDSVSHKLDTTNDRLDTVTSNLNTVKMYAQRIDSTLAPFKQLATRKYPKLDSTAALTKLYKDITINIKTDVINAPNAQIATINQTGNNFIFSAIPNVFVNGKWLFIDRLVDSVARKPILKKKEKLPTERFPYSQLYIHQFEITYRSPVMRNRIVFVLNENKIFDVDIKHSGRTQSGKGRIPNPGKYQGYYYVNLTQPEDGNYLLTFYSTKKIVRAPNIEAID